MDLLTLLARYSLDDHRELVQLLIDFIDAEESLALFPVTDRSAQKDVALATVRGLVDRLGPESEWNIGGDELYDISEAASEMMPELQDWLIKHSL
jgi:hypothetical protein